MAKKEPTLREKLVANILYYAGDEFEAKESIKELAMASDYELIDRLIGILDFYYDEAQNNA